MAEWADKYRRLSTKLAAEPGPYRTARTPYLRGIMEALSANHPARRVVFMKAAQVGATEAGNNWLGYIIHWTPAPVIGVWPTVEAAERISKQRIEPLIEDSPELRELIPSARSRDSGNTLRMKEFPGGVMVLTGANSGVGLRSMPARYAFCDEIDAYPGDVDGEGDPVDLVRRRVQSFGRFGKMFLVSTPTVQGMSRIEREYEASDKRRFFIPCPHCGSFQWLKFERLRWEKGNPASVAYVCEDCDESFEERYKTEFLGQGEWRATSDSADAGTVGFHISGLYSPLGWLTWEDIARQWEEAQGNDASLKAFKNTVLGETWHESGEAPEWKRLSERKEDYWLKTVPEGVLFLTAGADVQRDRVEVHVWGWGRDGRSWLIDVRHFEGDTSRPEVWAGLNSILNETWVHDTGARIGLSRMAIDTGDGLTTSVVYAWVRSAGDRRVLAIKGNGSFDRSMPVSGPTYVDINQAGKKIRRGIQLWTVAVSVFKSETYRFLRMDRPSEEEVAGGAEYPSGYIHLPSDISDEWVKQLVSEQLISVENRRTKYRKLEWHKLRPRNEALDCRGYARAAAWLIGADRWKDSAWSDLEHQFDGDVDGKEVRAASVRSVPRPAQPRSEEDPTQDTVAPKAAAAVSVSRGRRVRPSSWMT